MNNRPIDAPPDVAVLICTYNRAPFLSRVLDSLAAMVVPATWRWEVVVVDNNSTDATARTVEKWAAAFPVPVRYLFEATPGKSSAMNTGLRSVVAPVVAFADDDVVVPADWLVQGCSPLLCRSGLARPPAGRFAYTGGPVEPAFEQPAPSWFPTNCSDLWGTVAILNYGDEPFIFEDERKIPLGANFAIRRELAERVGGFLPQLGRSQAGTILGQELPEFFRRARRIGARGLYVPGMRVRHHVPASRMTPRYFRRWWFGKGVSRARLDRLHPVTELGLDLGTAKHVGRVPRFMYGTLVRDLGAWARALIAGDGGKRLACETRAAYFAGYFWERQRERRAPSCEPADVVPPVVAGLS